MAARIYPLLLLLCPSLLLAQTPSPTAPAAAAPSGTVLQAGTELVVLDVVVQDSKGQAVHNLPRTAFQVAENKAPQTVQHFEEHSTANPPTPGPQMPPLPPGTFTDYTAVPANGALNVLLIDALNTPMADQQYLRYQLQQYVKKAQPGTRIAIFGLNSRLFFLQGFTSDVDVLRNVVNHKLIPRASVLMDNPVSGGDDTSLSDAAADAGLAETASNLSQFETQYQSYQTQLRIQYTLDAFDVLAHYLAAFPGRKNLIWFSGSFPIDILPDATLDNPFSVLQVNDDEFRETTSLLTRGQVAVYPVDARGLMTDPTFSAANANHSFARNPGAAAASTLKFAQSQADEHITMEQMASDTGGRAFYNTNGLADAVASAIYSGSNYYTLTYTPTNHTPHGEYRETRVTLSNDFAAAGYKLYYRHGYYANDPKRPSHTKTVAAAPATAPPAPSRDEPEVYARAVMSRGAPEPTDMLFKVRVLPASTGTDSTLTAQDGPDPSAPFKGPYRRYNVDFASLASDVRLSPGPDGTRAGAVEFRTFVYDNDGKLLNAVGQTIQMHLTPEQYKNVAHGGIGAHLAVSAPAKGEAFLRIAVHDLNSNRWGIVEIPTSSVAALPPAPAPQAGQTAGSPSTQTAPSTTSAPAGKQSLPGVH